MGPIVDITRASHDRLAVNVAGPLFTLQAVARHMIARGGGGKIITMASQAGRRAGRWWPSIAPPRPRSSA
jgi:D-sorbitol dehydrogenase (acceptor)